jgi:hypothetical protein
MNTLLTVIGIQPPPGVPMPLVMKDVAEAVSEGYGAGTIMVPGYEHLFGSWTSVQKNIDEDPTYTIVINSNRKLGPHGMADLLLTAGIYDQ